MRRAAFLAAFVVLAAGPLSAAGSWYDEYERGVKAVHAQQWAPAEKHLKAAAAGAAAAGARPGRQVRTYGTHFITFIPGYYLGIVYVNTQRWREAHDELERVAASGLVAQGDPEYPRLQDLLRRVNQALTAAASTTPPPPPTTAPSPSEASRLVAEARRLLDNGDVEGARQALEAARALEPELLSLRALAISVLQAETMAEEVVRGKETAKRMAEAVARVAAARYQDPDSIQSARGALARARSFGIKDTRLDELESRMVVVEGLADLARLIGRRDLPAARRKASDLARLDARHPDLVPLQAELERLVTEGNERAGVRAFFRGQYQTAIELLGARPHADSPRAQFYLACSNAGLGLLKGADASGEPFLARARSLFARVRPTKPQVPERERRLISPRIYRLFEAS